MNTFIYGTGNAGKMQFMQEVFRPLALRLVGIGEYLSTLPEVNENGKNPAENARIKALTYFRALPSLRGVDYPLFSCDSGLYIEGLPEDEQPGVHIRRVGNRVLTDEEVIDYYSSLVQRLSGEVMARYRNAICLVISEGEIYEYMGDDIASDKFMMVAKPHPKHISGFRLDCLSVQIDTGRYYNDLEFTPPNASQEGFRQFFRVLACSGSWHGRDRVCGADP